MSDILQDVKLDESIRHKPNKKFKSHTIIVVLLLLFVMFIFFLGSFGGDFFALFVFFIFFSIPLIVIFNKQIMYIFPSYIADKLLIDENKSEREELEFRASVPQYFKDLAIYGVIFLFYIGALYMLYVVYKELKNPPLPSHAFKNLQLVGRFKEDSKKIMVRLLAAAVCTCIAGVTLLDIDTNY